MGFGDYNIQHSDGRKEKLGDIKHGVRKEQLDSKYQALFDAYDANKDGTLEAEELDNIFKGLQNFAGSDRVLDANENTQVKSIFAEQLNIQDVDFQGFVKSVSDASAEILSSSEKRTPDGGKEVTTTYKDGTVETISYYLDGEIKFKKTIKNSVSVLSETQNANASQALGNTPTGAVVVGKNTKEKIPNIENAIKELIENGEAATDVAKKYKIDRNKLIDYYNSLLAPVSDDMLYTYGDTETFKKLREYVANNTEIIVATLNNGNPEQEVTIVSHKTNNDNFYIAYDIYGDAITKEDLHDTFGITKVNATDDGAFSFKTDSIKSVEVNQSATRRGNVVTYYTTLKDYLNAKFPKVSVAVSRKVNIENTPCFIAETLGVNIATEDGKKVVERLSYLPQEALEKLKDSKELKELKELVASQELEPTFDNISNILEITEGVTLRNEEEYKATEAQRQEILTQIKAANFMANVYEILASYNDQYTDSVGLFGLGTEAIGYVLNKLGLDGENHYQVSDSCREWAKNASELKVLNPQKFKEGFKKIYGKNADKWGIDYNSDAFKKCFALAESGKAYDKDNKMTDEYKEAILKAMNIVAYNPNDSTFNQVMNGFGEALIMIATLGWGAETKAGATLATTTMSTFSKAGVALASKQAKNKLLQGALRFSGQAVKLVGPALNEGTKMYLYTAAEGTLANVSNRAIKQDGFDRLLDTQAQVMTNANGSFTFGAFAGVFGSTVTQKVMQRASKVASKVTTALSEKFSKGAVNANEVFATILEKSAPTKIAEAAAFATDVVGFTAFESALSIANTLQREGTLTPEKLADTLMEEFGHQGYSLGQIKVVSHLIMMLTGSRSARMQSQKYLQENLPQLKGATLDWVNGGKDGFKINLPDGRRIECKNASEMISSLHLMVRGETAFSGKFDKLNPAKGEGVQGVRKKSAKVLEGGVTADELTEVAPKAQETEENKGEVKVQEAKAQETTAHDNVLNELQKREDTVKNGELPTIKDVEFNEGFGLSYKASTNPLSKGEWTFNGKKVANSKKELLAQLKEQGIEVPNRNTDIDRFLAKLKTKEDFQNASICLYQTKNILALHFNLVKTPEDAVICGMLAEKRVNDCYYQKGFNAIKENPALYKVFDEGIDALNSKVGYPDDSYMIYDAAKQLDTPQKCEAFLELVKNNNEKRYELRELIADNILPQNINEIESFSKILNYRGCTRFTRNAYLKLPKEVRNVLNKHLETHTNERGYAYSLDYNICQKLIDGLKNKETQAELMKLINGAKDFEELENIYRQLPINYDKDILVRMNSLISSGLDFKYDVREYIEKSPENKFYASEEYFQGLLNSLKNEAFKSKIGRTPTTGEAKIFGKIKEDWKKEYALSKINAKMLPYEVEGALYEASMVESKEQIDLADILSTTKGDSITFYKGGFGIRTYKRDLYKYLTTKEDIEAFKELQKHLPFENEKDGYLYQYLIENGRLSKSCALINSCRSLKEACQESFNNVIKNIKNEFQENVLLSLNTLCEKRPELGKVLNYNIENLVKNCDSKEKADLIKKNIETLIGADKDFVEILDKNYFNTNVINVLTSENFDLGKYELVKPYIKKDGWDNNSTAVEIAISKIDKETLKKALKVSTELYEVLSFANNISSENKRLANTMLDDKVALKDIENAISVYQFFRRNNLMDKLYDSRLSFYNEFKNNKRFSQKELTDVMQNIYNDNFAFAEKLCADNEFPKEHIASILYSVKEENMAFAEKLCADNEFPKEHVADIVSATNKDNMAFAEKLCANKEFPKNQIAGIVSAINKDNIELAKKLCADEEFPKDKIAKILQATYNGNIAFAKQLCADKEFPKDKIVDILNTFRLIDVDIKSLSLSQKINTLGIILSIDKALLNLWLQYSPVDISTKITELTVLLGKKKDIINVSAAQQQMFVQNIIANNNQNTETVLKNFDFEQYGKQGLPLKYTREQFTANIENLIKDLSPEEQQVVLKHFGLIKGSAGFDGLPTNKPFNSEKVSLQVNEIAQKVQDEIETFTARNQIDTGDATADNVLNGLIKGLPEFTSIVGKEQHGTHAYSVDIHTLKVLQSAMNNPLYERLSDRDKTILKIAALCHDLGKRGGVVDTGHASSSAEYVTAILDKFPFPQGMKDRIIDIVDNHHWFEAYNTGSATAEDVAVRCRRPEDFMIYEILAKADFENVNKDFHISRASGVTNQAEFDRFMQDKMEAIDEALTRMYSRANLVFDTQFMQNGEKFPRQTIEVNGEPTELKVLNLNNLKGNDSLQEYGFSTGVTKESARFTVHMTDPVIASMKSVMILTQNSLNQSAWSTSLIKASNNRTYCNRKFGFVLDVDQANISEANYANTGSGCGKGLETFKSILFDANGSARTYVKDHLIKELSKKGVELNDNEYAQLSRFLVAKKYTTQITKNIKIGDKVIKAADLVECLEKSRDALFEGGDIHSEIVPINPRVKGMIAKVEKLEDCPEEFLIFAKEHNLPIILMKPTKDNDLD